MVIYCDSHQSIITCIWKNRENTEVNELSSVRSPSDVTQSQSNAYQASTHETNNQEEDAINLPQTISDSQPESQAGPANQPSSQPQPQTNASTSMQTDPDLRNSQTELQQINNGRENQNIGTPADCESDSNNNGSTDLGLIK